MEWLSGIAQWDGSGAGQLDNTAVGPAHIGGWCEVPELEECLGGSGGFGVRNSKLVQSKDRIIGDQQNIVWSLPIYFAKTWRLNLNHLEEGD